MYSEWSLGWCHAWIGTLPLLGLGVGATMVGKDRGKRLADMSWYRTRETVYAACLTLLFFLMFLYSLVLPLEFSTGNCRAGLLLYLVAFGALVSAYTDYLKTDPHAVVKRGVYRFSRNPIYFFNELSLLGVGIAADSPVMLILLAVYALVEHLLILSEEQYCLNRYGIPFRKYMTEIPRYFLFM